MNQSGNITVDSTPLRSSLTGAIALVIALGGIACAYILTAIAEREIAPYATTFYRLGIAAIAFALWKGLVQINRLWSSADIEYPASYTLGDLGMLAIAGVTFAASLACSAWSLTQTSVANSTLLTNTMPIFVTLGAWLFLGQRFSVKFISGMIVAVCGVIAIGIGDLQVAGDHLLGDATALLAAIFGATCLVSLERLRVKFSTLSIMQWTCLAGSLSVLPIALVTEDRLFPTSLTGWLAVVTLAIVSQTIGQGLITYSLKQFSSGFIAVSMLAIPLIAAVLAAIIFSEILPMVNWLAFLVVLAGIYLAISARSMDTTQLEE